MRNRGLARCLLLHKLAHKKKRLDSERRLSQVSHLGLQSFTIAFNYTVKTTSSSQTLTPQEPQLRQIPFQFFS